MYKRQITYLKDGTEIHWIVNPNQDGVYQQKLDEALSKQADAAAAVSYTHLDVYKRQKLHLYCEISLVMS